MNHRTTQLMGKIISEAMREGTDTGEQHEPYITVYKPIAGWKAIMYWWNPEGFWEPWDTSPFAFASEESAEKFGREWAKVEEIEFKEVA